MFVRRLFATAILLAAACQASGCRSGVAVHGHSCALFVVPMYEQPAGYSSTYYRQVAASAQIVEYGSTPLKATADDPVGPAADEPPEAPGAGEKVIIPQPCGPVCRQPDDARSRGR